MSNKNLLHAYFIICYTEVMTGVKANNLLIFSYYVADIIQQFYIDHLI